MIMTIPFEVFIGRPTRVAIRYRKAVKVGLFSSGDLLLYDLDAANRFRKSIGLKEK